MEIKSKRSEAYLNESVDIHGLKRCMRKIDDCAHTLATGPQYGLVLC